MSNNTLKNMIDSYIYQKMEEDIKYIKRIKDVSKSLSFEEYLKRCLTFFPEHKWFLHLDKANIQVFQRAFTFLRANQCQLIKIECFDELISYIDGSKINKFGELSIYDTAVAIGISMDIRPDKVFLHAGPQEAMKFILGDKYNRTIKYLKRNNRIKYVDIEDMPREFDVFNDKRYLIEDCLCYIYSRFLKDN